MPHLDRRTFIASTAAASAAAFLPANSAGAGPRPHRARLKLPVVISSGNGMSAINRAMLELRSGADPIDAVVAGVTLVEDDPNDMSVGYGGLPNENGIVQLDASVMHGPTHKAGAVAALENIRNAAQVALEVLKRTDHVMLVGAGALAFAKAMGHEEQDMLTDKARERWIKWKSNLNSQDDWLDEDQHVTDGGDRVALTRPGHGTIHCAAVDEKGDIGACTTTSGLSFKVPGRVGDSPIIGAGMFVDNAVGAAGATGRGESLIQSCGAFQVVQHMSNGDDPTEACIKVLKWIADHTKRAMLLNERGEPNFGATIYAVRKDGAYGSASMRRGASFSVHDGGMARKLPCESLYE